MNPKEIQEVFIRFLKKNHAHTKFITNIQYEYPENTIQEIINRTSYKDLISYSFTWNESPEGRDFWMGIHTKWQEYIKG